MTGPTHTCGHVTSYLLRDSSTRNEYTCTCFNPIDFFQIQKVLDNDYSPVSILFII